MHAYTAVRKDAKRKLKLRKKTFSSPFLIGGISIGGGGVRMGPLAPGYVYDCNFNAICDIKILFAFLLVCPCVCQSDTNGSILYDNAKYVILLVKVEIVLNSCRNLKL